MKMSQIDKNIKPINYSNLNVIQKINVKHNSKSYGEKYGTLVKGHKAMTLALIDLSHRNYTTPYLHSGNNPVY